MIKPENHILTIKSGYSGESLTIDFAPDSDTEDMKEKFAIIMKFLTFGEQEWLKPIE